MSLAVENLDLSQYSIDKRIEGTKYSNFYEIKENQTQKIYRAEISRNIITKDVKEVNSFFKKEVHSISLLDHPSILKIFGFNYKDFNSKNRPTIITEFFSVYSLEELTAKKNLDQEHIKMNDTEKMICIYGIASAMAFSHKNGIIHGDLSPETILIDDNFHPKIIFSKIMKSINEHIYQDEYDDTSVCVLSGLVRDSSSKEDDVFAFSLLLYLILKGHPMDSDKQNKPVKFRKSVPHAFRELFNACYSEIPEKRPTFEEIIRSLRSNKKFLSEKVNTKKFYEYADSLDDNANISTTDSIDEINYMHDENSYLNNEDSYYLSIGNSYVSIENSYISDEISYISNENSVVSNEISHIDDDDNDDVIEPIRENSSICKFCKKQIENQIDLFNYHGYLYHTNCVRCRICDKHLITIKGDKSKGEKEEKTVSDDFVYLYPDFFLCRDHFKEYKNQRNPLPREIQVEYANKMIRNTLDELFYPYENDTDALPLNKLFKYFVPSVTFHFTNSPGQIDYNELLKVIPEDMIIINIERGSTFLTIAFIAAGKALQTERDYYEIISPLRLFFNSAIGHSIIGNMDKMSFSVPDEESIKMLFCRDSINLLHLEDILKDVNFDIIEKEVKKRLKKKQQKEKWDLIFNNQKLYDEAEEAVRKEIEENEIDLIVTGITIIANNQYESFKKLETKILNKEELYLFHGTKIEYQIDIAKEGFLSPDELEKKGKIIKTTDTGEFGKGFYATNNIFYALMYSSENKNQYLEINEKNSVICCKTIYNKDFMAYLNNLKNSKFYNQGTFFFGQDMHEDIKENNGIHQIFVESKTSFHPCGINNRKSKQSNNNKPSFVTAFEYVFPNSNQLIPVFSLTIMRPEYYVLWLNEKGENDNESSNYLFDLRHEAEVNVYYKQTIDEAFKLVNRKTRCKLKFIITVENIDLCRNYINRIRGCHQNNFICLIFSSERRLIELSLEMENVIFTDEFVKLDRFIKMPLENDLIINFCEGLENKYKIKFNINEDQLIAFHSDDWIN